MKRVIVVTLLAAFLAGCEDFPVEGVGGDDFAAAAHHAFALRRRRADDMFVNANK